jgi:molybdenum cofactor cytidylyltransferase
MAGLEPHAPDSGPRIAGVILAAGESSRMGFPKALLPYRGLTFLETLARLLADARLEPLLVVLGHEHERIRSSVQLPPATEVLINEDYRLGQLSSLETAIRHLLRQPAGAAGQNACRHSSALLAAPVDHPCVAPETVASLLGMFATEAPDVVVPTFHGRRGHPVIFAARLFPELLEAPLDQGARAVVHRHAVREVAVDDQGVLADIDDPELYRRWIG